MNKEVVEIPQVWLIQEEYIKFIFACFGHYWPSSQGVAKTRELFSVCYRY
jgi:hypothetical protein